MTDDAIRQKSDVAKAMLLGRGAHSGHDSDFSTHAQNQTDKVEPAKSTPEIKLNSEVGDTLEGKGAVWVKGRCGKVIPLAIRKVDRHEQGLVAFLTQVTKALERKALAEAAAKQEEEEEEEEEDKRNQKAVGQMSSNVRNRSYRKLSTTVHDRYQRDNKGKWLGRADALEGAQRIVNIFHEQSSKLNDWLDCMFELHRYIAEDLPPARAIQWAASEYCLYRDKLMPEICKNISLGKFLKNEIQLLQDVVLNPEATLLRTTGQAAKILAGTAERKKARGSGKLFMLLSLCASGQAAAGAEEAERSQREEDAASALVEEEQVRADVASASPGVDAESDFCLPNQSAPPQVAAAARSCALTPSASQAPSASASVRQELEPTTLAVLPVSDSSKRLITLC